MSNVLSGKVAIITGANRGLGFEIAKAYVLAGADVMMIARDAALLQSAQLILKKLTKPDQRVLYIAGDVSVESDVGRMVRDTIRLLNGCHILVNNAGIYGLGSSVLGAGGKLLTGGTKPWIFGS